MNLTVMSITLTAKEEIWVWIYLGVHGLWSIFGSVFNKAKKQHMAQNMDP